MNVRSVNCPACGNAVKWESGSRYKPFCSERCKLLDLGAWATEKYRIAKPPEEADEEKPSSNGEEGI